MGTMTDTQWKKVAHVADVPENGGACVKINDKQIAVFNFTRTNEWYATDNMCPHKQQMILSRGMIGDLDNEPKVACPFHKKNFSLKTGACLSGDDYQIKTYPIKVENEYLYIDTSSIQ
jgi:nitrite reductase (NADH) small subunit